MSKIIDFHRRYEVQVAQTISTLRGVDMQGSWDFHFGFHELSDAMSAAERLSEENRWVRVVDTQEDNEENA